MNQHMYLDLGTPPWRTVDDITLVPKEGKLNHRGDAILHPFIYSAPMDTVTGYELTKKMISLCETPVVSRAIPKEELIETIVDFSDSDAFFAVGLNGDLESFLNIVKNLSPHISINVAIDVAHGDMTTAHKTATELLTNPHIRNIMSGSICTPEAAIRAVEAGCTHLRVGVGPGSVCTTRLMTGCGLPNLTAVYLIYKAIERQTYSFEKDPIIIADGGIKHPGDAIKYLCAGANAVMLGSVLSKAREAAGWQRLNTDPDREQLIKKYRGQASADFQKDHFGRTNICPEGVNTQAFYWEGQYVEDIINKFRGGLSSACSYLGVCSSAELDPYTVNFAEITHSGYIEGTPHGAS